RVAVDDDTVDVSRERPVRLVLAPDAVGRSERGGRGAGGDDDRRRTRDRDLPGLLHLSPFVDVQRRYGRTGTPTVRRPGVPGCGYHPLGFSASSKKRTTRRSYSAGCAVIPWMCLASRIAQIDFGPAARR